LIEGKLKFRTWEADDGSKRSKHSVTLDRFSFVGSRNDSNGASSEEMGDVPF
jgi:single-strand DNA-binding protein